MDSKPLLQDKPPAYNAVPGAYEYGQQHNYGAIPPHAPPPPHFQQPPPPYPYPDGQGKLTGVISHWASMRRASPLKAVKARLHQASGHHRGETEQGCCLNQAPGHNWVCVVQFVSRTGFTGRGQPNYGGTYTIIQPSVVVVGGCPACRVGVLEDDFTCLGILCAIVFFPIGILFCLALRQRRCPNCGATFGPSSLYLRHGRGWRGGSATERGRGQEQEPPGVDLVQVGRACSEEMQAGLKSWDDGGGSVVGDRGPKESGSLQTDRQTDISFAEAPETVYSCTYPRKGGLEQERSSTGQCQRDCRTAVVSVREVVRGSGQCERGRVRQWSVGQCESGRVRQWSVGQCERGRVRQWSVGQCESGRVRQWSVGQCERGRVRQWSVGQCESGHVWQWSVGQCESGRVRQWSVGQCESGRVRQWSVLCQGGEAHSPGSDSRLLLLCGTPHPPSSTAFLSPPQQPLQLKQYFSSSAWLKGLLRLTQAGTLFCHRQAEDTSIPFNRKMTEQ
ncbi:hypothetical protein JZ751_010714 [Albula glossodonta]|uniref:Membrane protein BRI3 n=1 Tax=Albula glossodonta TaxID=121402 RepID=A0A8T2N192_9TELE|nr:hypothetical protein JZ751_010714 [Albula glossodonta]